MYKEAAEAPLAVARQIKENARRIKAIAEELRIRKPKLVVTCARGSSNNAAMYAKYLIETVIGVPTASAELSITTIYNSKQNLTDTLVLAISQSGESPDLCKTVDMARRAGAYVIAIVNVENSPLAEKSDWVIPIRAGKEVSVAATKSYLTALSALLQLVGFWSRNEKLRRELMDLPNLLQQAWDLDWSDALDPMRKAQTIFTVARGFGKTTALEAALKLKETAGVHAEGFSSAEVRHGPIAIINSCSLVFAFVQEDETRTGIEMLIDDFVSRGVTVVAAGSGCDNTISLPTIRGNCREISPLLFAQSFYKLANHLALSLGLDPDEPPHLKKVTETV